MKLTFQQFSGIAPRIAPRLLPATLAQEALDVKLWSFDLTMLILLSNTFLVLRSLSIDTNGRTRSITG